MNELVLHRTEHRRLVDAFVGYLRGLGYAQETVRQSRWAARHMLCFLEGRGQVIETAQREDIAAWLESLAQPGQRSASTVTVMYQGLRRLHRYLWQDQGEAFTLPPWKTPPGKARHVVLSRQEVAALYEACQGDCYGQRDRAMLSLYYGCGLRRSEGLALEVGDVLLDRGLLYVRQGKGSKERYVPLAEGVAADLKGYLGDGRPQLALPTTSALLVGRRGGPLGTVLPRLHALIEQAAESVPTLKGKPIVLHTLRHSIATHLMESGMALEAVQQFLGHRSLESTQRYTHILDESISHED